MPTRLRHKKTFAVFNQDTQFFRQRSNDVNYLFDDDYIVRKNANKSHQWFQTM